MLSRDDYSRTSPPPGWWPVMLTPYTAAGGIDFDALDRLTDWYLEHGASGLFAVCGSSEMYRLSAEERHAYLTRVTRRVGFRAPVAATSAFTRDVRAAADQVRAVHDAGATVAVLIPALLAAPDESDDVLTSRIGEILSETSGELGLYECPGPYHRLVPESAFSVAVGSGRFTFGKDTCRDATVVRQRCVQAHGSRLRWMTADLAKLLMVLESGGAGYCGIAGNCIPDMIKRLCDVYAAGDMEAARALSETLTRLNVAAHTGYSTTARIILAARGVPITPVSRSRMSAALTAEELGAVSTLLEAENG